MIDVANKTSQQIAEEMMISSAKGQPISQKETGVSSSGEDVKPAEEPTNEPEEEQLVMEGGVDDVRNPDADVNDKEAVAAEPTKSDELSLDDWDVDLPASTSDAPVLDYVQVASELGFKASTKEELAAEIEKIKADAQKAEELGQRLEGVPADLLEAIEAAKSGQDYRAIFATDVQFDHRGMSDEALLKEGLASYFLDQSGNVDEDAVNEYLDSMTDAQKRVEAAKVRANIDRINQEAQAKKVNDMRIERMMREQELKDAVTSMDNVRGFKVTPSHKQRIMQDIATGEAMKKMLYKADGKTPDMKKVAEAYFIFENFDKIKSFLIQRTTNDVRKEDFKRISNAEIRRPSTPPAAVTQKPQSELDRYMADLRKRAGIQD